MALDHRIQVRDQDASQFATLQTNETGAMVLVTPKGSVKPKRNNNGKDILRRYGTPSAEHWGLFEALSFVGSAPLYVACAVGAGARYAGVDVNANSVVGFGYGRPDPEAMDFAAVPTPRPAHQFGTGDGTTTAFSGTIPSVPVQQGSLTILIGGVAIATTDASGTITGAGIASGTVNYTNGTISVTFTTAPANGAVVSVSYRQIVDNSAVTAFSLFKASPYNDDYERLDLTVTQVTGVPGVQYRAVLDQVVGTARRNIGTYLFSLLQEKDAFGRSTYIEDVFEGSDYIIPVINPDFTGTVNLISTPAVAEVADLTFVDEAGGGASSNYHNKYFLFETPTGIKYVLWFNVDGGGTAPIIPGRTAVAVAVANGALAAAIAGDVATAINGLPDISASAAAAVVTMTQDTAGACVDPTNGGGANAAPVTIAVTTQGADAINGSSAVTMDGGYRGAVPQAPDFLAAWQQFEAYNRYKAKILMDVYGNSANTIKTMQQSVLPYTHAITIVPMGNTVAQAIAFRQGLSINFDKMSIYYNFHRIQDPYNVGSTAWVSGVGKIGAKYAAMEDVYDSLSPAGIDENGHGGQLEGFTPIETEYDIQPADKVDLDNAQINGIVLDDEDGLMLIGDWTMQTVLSDTSYIGTRRLYNLLLEAIAKQVLRRQVFKNNDTFHRLKAFNLTDSLLAPIKAGEFIFDYRVQCDTDNNDAAIRNARKFVLTVFIQATANSQEVQLDFVRLPQGDVLASLGGA